MAKQRRTPPPPAPSANHSGVTRPQGGPHPGHGDGCTICAVATTEAYLRGVAAANKDAAA